MVQAAFERDYPVIMGNLVIVSSLTLLANLLADLAYSLVDPRIRVGRRRR
jgi:peptide/nickel transport system permease protein